MQLGPVVSRNQACTHQRNRVILRVRAIHTEVSDENIPLDPVAGQVCNKDSGTRLSRGCPASGREQEMSVELVYRLGQRIARVADLHRR